MSAPVVTVEGWGVLAARLYGESAAGVTGARPWSELPASERGRWYVAAAQYESGRRRYERSGVGGRGPAWAELDSETRAAWIRDAVRYPGRV